MFDECKWCERGWVPDEFGNPVECNACGGTGWAEGEDSIAMPRGS